MDELTEMAKIQNFDSNTKIKFGIVFHVLQRLNGVDQKTAAKISGKVKGTISTIVHGQSGLWFPNLVRAIPAIGVTITYFFNLFENKDELEKVLYKYRYKFKYPKEYIELFLSYWTDNPSPIEDPIKYLFPNGKF